MICRVCGARHDVDVIGGAGDGPLRGAADLALVLDDKSPPAPFNDLSGGRFTRWIEILDLRGPTGGRKTLYTGTALLCVAALTFAIVIFVPGMPARGVLGKLLAASIIMTGVALAIMFTWSRPMPRRAVVLDGGVLRELRNRAVIGEVSVAKIDAIEATSDGLLVRRAGADPLPLVRGAGLDQGDLRWLAEHLNRGLALARRGGGG